MRPRMSCFGLRCLETGRFRTRCQGFALFTGPYLSCRPTGSGECPPRSLSRSSPSPLLTTGTTFPGQPYQESHSKLLVKRRLSFQRPPHSTQELLPTRILEHIPSSPCLHRLKQVVWVLVHGDHHDA